VSFASTPIHVEYAGVNRNIDAYFETRFGFDSRRDIIWKEVCRFLQKKYVPENSIILDLGAGYCNFINNIQGKEKHAVDLFSKIVDFANADVVTHVEDCTRMNFFPSEYFDVIFASNLLEHLNREDSQAVLSEASRILKNRGKLILIQPNFRFCPKTYFDDYTHLQIFTDRSLCDFLSANGFTILESDPRFLPVNMKSTLKTPVPKLPFFVNLYLRLPYRPFAGQLLIVAENGKRMNESEKV
jgi:SAM-dependent methyltransferase